MLKRRRGTEMLDEYFKRRTHYHIKKHALQPSPEELEIIKEKIRAEMNIERKRNNIILFSFSLTSVFIIVLLLKTIFFTPKVEKPNYREQYEYTRQQKIKKKEKEKFEFCIDEGFKYMAIDEFNNAIFLFNDALEILPNDYEANLGLTLTLLKKCNYTKEDCELANKQLEKLLLEFPDAPNIKKTISSYLLEIGDTTKANKLLELNQ